MSILSWLGLEPRADARRPEGLDAVAHALEALGPERARFVAALAFTLSRVANADREISAGETRRIERLLVDATGLPPAQASLVAHIAEHQNRLFGATHDFLATRELRDHADREEKLAFLQFLFAVSAADGSISVVEEEEIRRIANELGLTPQEFVAARGDWREQREILK